MFPILGEEKEALFLNFCALATLIMGSSFSVLSYCGHKSLRFSVALSPKVLEWSVYK